MSLRRQRKGRWESEPRLWRRNSVRLTNFASFAEQRRNHVFRYNAKRLSPCRVYGTSGRKLVRKTPESVRKTMRHLVPGRIFRRQAHRGWGASNNRRQPRMTMRFSRRKRSIFGMGANESRLFKSSEKIRIITDRRWDEYLPYFDAKGPRMRCFSNNQWGNSGGESFGEKEFTQIFSCS